MAIKTKKTETFLDLRNIQALMITAPSGGGKGAAIEKILKDYPEKFFLSKSATTKQDTGNGEFYEFISNEEFQKRIFRNYFIEYEEINGDFYGTPHNQFDLAKKEGRIVLLDIDVKGAIRMKNILKKSEIPSLFVFVDSGDNFKIYEERIRNRKRGEAEEKIKKRVDRIKYELTEGMFGADIIISNKSDIESFLEKFSNCIF